MWQRILVINPFGVGDVLFSTPLISALKKMHPGSYIGYICNIRTKGILETNPEIDELLIFERDEYRALWKRSKKEAIRKFFKFWSGIGRRKFDIVFDLSLGKEYAFLCWVAGIKERRGFDYKGRGRFLTHRIKFEGFNEKPVPEYYLDLLDAQGSPRLRSGQARLKAQGTVLVTTDADREYVDNFLKNAGVNEKDFLVGIAPGGGVSFGEEGQDRRRWPAKKFSELADRLVADFNAKIVLIWGPGEEGLVRSIADGMTEKALIAPKTSIREMAALCKRCRIVICSEGGPLHIAASQDVRTISIFGPVDEKVYGPYPPDKPRNIAITSDAGCRPCYKRFKLPECDNRKCIDDVSVETVFNAVSK